MNQQEAIEFFIRQSLGYVRALPMHEAIGFLKGLLLVGEQHEELEPLRAVYTDFCAIESQLETLQMRLGLEEAKS